MHRKGARLRAQFKKEAIPGVFALEREADPISTKVKSFLGRLSTVVEAMDGLGAASSEHQIDGISEKLVAAVAHNAVEREIVLEDAERLRDNVLGSAEAVRRQIFEAVDADHLKLVFGAIQL